MRIDLHTHSSASDGTDTPADLVRAAAAAGLDVVALTDHDAMSGWAEAAEAADEVGITLVPGLEISTAHHHRGVHLLAYLPDASDPALVAALDRILAGRTARTPAIVDALQRHGIAITEDDVRRESGGSVAAGRPHVADALVRLGHADDRTQAFADLLDPGRPGYANRYAVPLEDMIPLVTGAGGVAVIAHPWGRNGRSVLDVDTLAGAQGPRARRDRGRPPGPLRGRPRRAAGDRRRPRPARHRQQRPPRARQGRPRPRGPHDGPGAVRAAGVARALTLSGARPTASAAAPGWGWPSSAR